MQLPPGLQGRLGPGPARGPPEAPPLPVLRHPAVGTAPFRFAPRAQNLPRGHPLFEDGDVQRHAYLHDVITQVSQPPERPRVATFGCHVAGCQQEFGSLEAYEHHYRTLHTHVCSVCRRSFPSARLLDVHVLEWHDSLFQLLAERQSMHQCLVEGCSDTFRSSRERREHLVRAHRYPPDFRFDQPRRPRGPSRPIAAGEEAMEVCPAEPASGPNKRPHGRRIPATICFGQGAARGFKNAKKRSDR
ncbi:zinc finger protein 511-like [Trichosurus vulpecula]|uniref:zinc finger protein 511-like n=1 Tax=Trichosurus vulpecula TaxID=9337 RepID=UPI00186AF283|nr:zinc finger protein 511-like [Trichosurus vulpecula]